jgi:uncharacterized membrane protein YedE/YeeE
MEMLAISLLFAFILGFSAHRTGVCTVAAVSELITSKSARIFLSFLKVILWVLVINGIATALMPELARPYLSQPLSLPILAGGFIFGVGAAINGACSFATISKIAQGKLHVALTLPAFILGIMSYTWFLGDKPPAVEEEPLLRSSEGFSIALIVLTIWALREVIVIIWSILKNGNYWSAVRAKRYRLSTGAAVVGVCSGFLFLIHGRWAYSSQLIDYATDNHSAQSVSGMIGISLFLALLTGAIASAISSRQFEFSFAKSDWHKNLIGGFLMGFGAIMIPGGNAKLILQDIPQLSAHAIPAYLAMVLGIALTLMMLRRLYGEWEIVNCSGDTCKISCNK